jgi:hypothetical protein
MKRCRECGRDLPPESFSRNGRNRDGLETSCKDCRLVAYRAWVARNRERQREINRESHARHREARNRAQSERRKGNPQPFAAREKLKKAVKRGRITRPSECESCSDATFVEAHHPDYAKPYAVIWLCTSCHHRLHA